MESSRDSHGGVAHCGAGRRRGVYGIEKVWHQLNREGIQVGRDRVHRLMDEMDLEGVVRGKRKPITTMTTELGENVQTRLAWLATYMGHRDPRFTYRYLSASPELLALAASRLAVSQEFHP